MLKGKKRISWQAIFTHSSGAGSTTTTKSTDAPGIPMDATKYASGSSSFDEARRPSTSISIPRQSDDFSMPTTTTTAPTTATPVLTASSSNFNVAKALPSRSSPPPSYLLDDDPFANLTPVGRRHRSSSSVGSCSSHIPHSQRPPPINSEWVSGFMPPMRVGVQAPKSRLQESLEMGEHDSDKIRRVKSQDSQRANTNAKKEETKRKRANTFFVTMSAPASPSKSVFAHKHPVPPLPTNSESISPPTTPNPSLPPRPFGMARLQPRPAYQRPAFSTRPSLPSLDTLAKTNIVLTNKLRKGRVGAGLPFEPWDNLPEDPEDDTRSYIPLDLSPPSIPHLHSEDDQYCVVPAQLRSDMTDVDRTPTSTPISAPPLSPTRSLSSSSSSSLTPTLATPPSQPFPCQIELAPLAEELEVETGRLSPSPILLERSLSRSDPALCLPVCASTPHPSTFSVESHTLAAPAPSLPCVSHHDSILKSFDVDNEVPTHGLMDPSSVTEQPNAYGNGDWSDAYTACYPTEPELNLDDFRRHWTELEDGTDEQATISHRWEPRWSFDASESNTDSQPHSPTYSSSNSYAGSVSDLSSGPSYSPLYAFGHSYGCSSDSMTDLTRDLTLSRSISSTSISTSSIKDDLESNINLGHYRNRSDSSQGDGFCDFLSHPTATFDSGNNSILHSPESEWASLPQQRPYFTPIPDSLVDSASKRRLTQFMQPLADFSVADQQAQVDSCPQDIIVRSDPAIAQEHTKTWSQGDSHAVALETFDESPATAEDLFSITKSDSAPPSQHLNHDQDFRFSFLEGLAELGERTATGTGRPILAEPGISDIPSIPLAHIESKVEVDNHEMNRVYERGHSYSKGHTSNKGSRREDDAEWRRVALLRMRSNPLGEDGEGTKSHGFNKSIDASFTSTSISRTPSSSSNPQQFPSCPSSTSDEDEHSNSSDDDIPLAQRIPGALSAQLSIRRQVNQEREARRIERQRRKRERQPTLRPGVDLTSAQDVPNITIPFAISHPASALMGKLPVHQRSGSVNQRLKPEITASNVPLPSQGDFGQFFKPEDLARKLHNVKIMNETSNASKPPSMRFLQHQQAQTQINKLTRSVSSNSRPPFDHTLQSSSASRTVSPIPKLQSKRSFHSSDAERLARDAVSPPNKVPLRKRTMSMGRGDKDGLGRRGREDAAPPLPNTSRVSDDRTGNGSMKLPTEGKTPSSRDVQVVLTSFGSEDVADTKTRIFIHSLQHPHVVDIRTDTSAGDLIGSLESNGVLNGWAGLGGWSFWEIEEDFGMERPVRSYELLSDIQGSWLKGKTANYFLLKKSPVASSLDPSVIPINAPSHSGWVEWEAKRGKWSKRWMHLKENSLYISKKDGRDDTLLCSLSNFDVYNVTRAHRAPKSFAFTVKSTDNLSFFENTADYMHNFCCSEANGRIWVEKILLARSYALRQERSALFDKITPNATSTDAPLPTAISRSGTKKTTATKSFRPLVDLSPGDIFEPGSLLSKQ